VKFILSQRFAFDAAHTLDRGESSMRVHGHTYFAEVSVSGTPNRSGMIVDLESLRSILDNVKFMLDHRLLNEVPLLGAPTIENLARFIYIALIEEVITVRSVKVWRADGGACLLEVAA
jgi:6-pyruvoyltetrahydropterin/6-carboxytetrahydropterin synthase